MGIIINGTTGIDLGHTPVSNGTNVEVEGTLNITGVGSRIIGNFSDATANNRTVMKTNVVNGASIVHITPDGTGVVAGIYPASSSDLANSGYVGLAHNSTFGAYINSGAFGTGTVMPLVFMIGGAEKMKLDTSGNLLLTSGTGALGYGTGSGGSVTQLTSKSTTVTLNKPTGQITMNNAALAGGATVQFIFNNNLITSNSDKVLPNIVGTVSAANYNIWCDTGGAGGLCTIFVKNISAGSLSEPIPINFAILKGATT